MRCDSRFLFFALTVQTIAPAMVPDEFPVMMEAAVVDTTGNHLAAKQANDDKPSQRLPFIGRGTR
jgi:hypothetical protein